MSRTPSAYGAVLAGAIMCAAPAAGRCETEKPELITDRPDFTESSVVVPRGSVQLESGFTYEKGPGGFRSFNAPELLSRWGVGRKWELRLGMPDYFRIRGSERASGFGDLLLGFKRQLGPLRGGLGASLIAGASFPTGARALSSNRVDPEAALTWATDLSERSSLSGMFGFGFPTEDGERRFIFQATVSWGRSLGGNWGAFLEYAGQFPSAGGDIHVIHHGYTYLLTSDSQLDLHFGFGLSRAAPDFFVGAGYSVRL